MQYIYNIVRVMVPKTFVFHHHQNKMLKEKDIARIDSLTQSMFCPKSDTDMKIQGIQLLHLLSPHILLVSIPS